MQGPTVTLRITSYTLMHDIAAAAGGRHSHGQALSEPPLVRSPPDLV